MNQPVKQYAIPFVCDGVSTTVSFDLSLLPAADKFRGALPQAVLTPVVTSVPSVSVPTVTAAVVGTTVTLTFLTAPQQLSGGILVVYTATFLIAFGD
jgi:hypothetical protein